MKIEEYKDLVKVLLQQDTERDAAFKAYEEMYHNDWKLPEGMDRYDYLHKVIDHSPHDAIQAGVRVLSSNPVKITVMPAMADDDNKAEANKWERVLKWQLHAADRRRPVSVVADVCQSALLYQAVAMTVVDLDWQIAQAKGLKADTRRIENAKRYGRFIVNTYNPRNIHSLRSSYGVEYVVLAQERLASEVMYEWGDTGKRLEKMAKAGETVEFYYCMGYDESCVWIEPKETGKEIVLKAPSSYDLPFMPWVAMMGGSTLEELPENKYHPMLYPVYKTGAWNTLNAVETLSFSEAMFKAFQKDKVVAGEIDERQDYTDPDGIMKVTPGTTVQQLAKQPLDPAKMEMVSRLQSNIERATVSRVLQGGDMSAESYAAMNLMTQTAVGALKPAKDLAEKALAEMFTLMVLWADYTETDLDGRGIDRRNDLGMEYKIEAQEINAGTVHIVCKLDPQIPTDQMQRANTANILRQLGYPMEYALEDVGVEDPEKAIEMHYMERIQEALVQAEIDKIAMAAQQEADAQAQQQQEAQAMAEQQAMQGPLMGGQGFNPAMGGTPPAVAAPTYTREDIMGEDAMGNAMESGL